VRAESGGEAFVDAATWDALQPKPRTMDEGRRTGSRKPTNPERYPLSTRIIDPVGERLIYECGRYVNTGAAECHHKTMDADAMLKLVLDLLVECVRRQAVATRYRSGCWQRRGPKPLARFRTRSTQRSSPAAGRRA
jgi:hypothetical protein